MALAYEQSPDAARLARSGYIEAPDTAPEREGVVPSAYPTVPIDGAPRDRHVIELLQDVQAAQRQTEAARAAERSQRQLADRLARENTELKARVAALEPVAAKVEAARREVGQARADVLDVQMALAEANGLIADLLSQVRAQRAALAGLMASPDAAGSGVA